MGGEAVPLLEDVEGPFDDVSSLVGFLVQPYGPAALAAPAFAVRFLIGAFRDHSLDAGPAQKILLAFEEYALSARARSGRERALPGPSRGTLRESSRCGNIGESPPCPGPSNMTSGRILPSQR